MVSEELPTCDIHKEESLKKDKNLMLLMSINLEEVIMRNSEVTSLHMYPSMVQHRKDHDTQEDGLIN